MQNVKNTMIEHLLEMVAPHLCCKCGSIGSVFCDNCKYNIIRSTFSGCIVCGCDALAGVCKVHSLRYHYAWVVGIRNGALGFLTAAFKFRFTRAALRELVWLLDRTVPSLPPGTVVVPVPTRPAHIRRRGYDHAALLAQAFARCRRLKCNQTVARTGQSVQHQLGRDARFDAARTAFSVRGSLAPDTPYLIVDDIVTTGATVAAVSEALYAAGARTIWVAAIAYQPLD